MGNVEIPCKRNPWSYLKSYYENSNEIVSIYRIVVARVGGAHGGHWYRGD